MMEQTRKNMLRTASASPRPYKAEAGAEAKQKQKQSKAEAEEEAEEEEVQEMQPKQCKSSLFSFLDQLLSPKVNKGAKVCQNGAKSEPKVTKKSPKGSQGVPK